ncbi:hypothetical protein [Amycolatopsis sp.]|uniref:hypothetical protein n=1 Tax=Amycolatopsis sp. TaxID=37632 RepID=UPI002D7E56CA|nr:hypothetical protein [Amycolatopsis sp.]HET6711299.1 hypothetical protein [Amycolatopsis sp.]
MTALVAALALAVTPATASARPGTLFRENFDRLPLGQVTAGPGWTTDVSGGSLTVEPSRTGHGRELRVRTTGNGRAFLVLPALNPPGNSFWVRMRVRVAAFPTAPDWAHWTIAEASGAGSPTLVRPIGGQYVPSAGANFYGVGSDLGPTGDWTAWQTSAPAVAAQWRCVEFHLDATDNRVTVYLDGVEQTALTVSTKHHGGAPGDFLFPAFDTLKLGWQLYQPDPVPSSYDVRLDDLTVSTHRLGTR